MDQLARALERRQTDRSNGRLSRLSPRSPKKNSNSSSYMFPPIDGASVTSPSKTMRSMYTVGGGTRALSDLFSKAVREIGKNRSPTEEELRVTREYLKYLTIRTREDHLKSVDEILSQVPTEFQAALRQLEEAENFVQVAAAGKRDAVAKRINDNWELVHGVDRDGHTALHAAAAMDHSSIVALLLEKGAAMNTQDYEGLTPLHWAAECSAVNSTQTLLDAGADALIRSNEGKTCLDCVPQESNAKDTEQTRAYLELALAKQSELASPGGRPRTTLGGQTSRSNSKVSPSQ